VGLFATQILVGAANVWTRLAPAAVTAHVAVAGLLWGAVVATAATTAMPRVRSAVVRGRVSVPAPSGPSPSQPEPIRP
jgi:hypothetical protein